MTERPSMRSYRTAWQLKGAAMDKRGDLLEWWLSGARLLVVRLLADPSIEIDEDQVKAFVEQGDECGATNSATPNSYHQRP